MNSPERVARFDELEATERAKFAEIQDLAKWAADDDLAVPDVAGRTRLPRAYALIGLATFGWAIAIGAAPLIRTIAGM